MLDWFSDTYGLYPFIDEKYSHVGIPIWGAMEDQTNTFFNLDLNWGSDWDWVIAHELAHMWWGDWVTCGTWKDLWLNEGFATFSEAHYYWHRDGPQAYHNYMKNNIMDYYISHEPFPPYPMYDPDVLFSVVTYEKGGAVLHMLRHILGEYLFFESLKAYGITYAEKSAVTSEFTAKVEEVSGMELSWFFNEWVYEPGHPEYEYGWWTDTLAADSFRVNLQVSQVQSHFWGVPTYKMPIDIYIPQSNNDTLKTVIDDSLDFQEFTFYTNSGAVNVLFDPGNWILKEATEVSPGVKEIPTYSDVNNLAIFPNPTKTYVWISFSPENNKPFDIYIYDITGRLIHTFLKNRGRTVWNLKNRGGKKVGKGIYFIQCRIGKKMLVSRKIIVL
jgi:aminopeptidase N